MEYKRRLRTSTSTADKKPLVDEGSQINGRSCEGESCPTRRQRRNFTESDVVLLKDNNTSRNKWPMARALVAPRDDNGQVRSVTVQSVTGSVLDRPVNKLVLLLESPKDRPGIPDEEPKELFAE